MKIRETGNRYANLAGEQEARYTQETMNMSPGQLAKDVLDLIRSGKTLQTGNTRPIRPIQAIKMAATRPQFVSKPSQDKLRQLHNGQLGLMTKQWNFREQMRELDLAFIREQDWTEEQWRARRIC